jgi:hypothetical protein
MGTLPRCPEQSSERRAARKTNTENQVWSQIRKARSQVTGSLI